MNKNKLKFWTVALVLAVVGGALLTSKFASAASDDPTLKEVANYRSWKRVNPTSSLAIISPSSILVPIDFSNVSL
jgi:hypothetical protein